MCIQKLQHLQSRTDAYNMAPDGWQLKTSEFHRRNRAQIVMPFCTRFGLKRVVISDIM